MLIAILSNRLEMDRINKTIDVNNPAQKIVLGGKLEEIASTAITFIGWTAMGIEYNMPVIKLEKPAKKSEEEKEIPFKEDKAKRIGKMVPISPNAPEISCKLNFAFFKFLNNAYPPIENIFISFSKIAFGFNFFSNKILFISFKRYCFPALLNNKGFT